MSDDLDRFDRMLLATESRAAASAAAPSRSGWVPSIVAATPEADPDPAPPIPRGPRFVDHMDCPLCKARDLGIEYGGELMSGAKVHTIRAHTEGKRGVVSGKPRCFGSGLRVVFSNGIWKGER